MNYKDTINLPKTDFKMKANLSSLEPSILEKWRDINIANYLMEKRRDAEKFILHDGPPYANGDIHIGTALNKVLKDIVIKYKTLQGYNSPYVPGWDTHGLPIEHSVITELGEKAEQFDKLEIRKICEQFAMKYVDIQRDSFKRLGVIGFWDNPYLTLKPEYEAKVLEVLKSLVETENVYRGKKPIYWCTECETALAEAEVEYHDQKSDSIYVKFPMKNEKDTYIVIWTTTPWTLPANVAIALHPDYEYAKIMVDGEYWILAKELITKTLEQIKIDQYKIIETFKGEKLEGEKAVHPFMNRDSLIVLAEYVTLDEGTGCVHTAPGHGVDDYKTGLKYDLPIISPVNDKGYFTEEAGKYAGSKIWKANEVIINDLKKSNFLLSSDKMVHSYPHCWRCKNPIIFRATEQWFIDLEKNNYREKVLEQIKQVNWIPKWGENRITSMVKERPDWVISRQRAWGVPIPAVKCKKCGDLILNVQILDNVIEIIKDLGSNAWFEKDVKDLLPKDFFCPKCGGSDFTKQEDILDVWIDSGASFEAVVNTREELKRFPADLYLEGSDQHRGWFQSSIFLSVAKHGKAPYKTVLTHGFIKDEEGRKMSKSLGNVINPKDVIDQYGADILRLWVASSDYTMDIKISNNILQQQVEIYRKLRNTLRFLLGNIFDFDPEKDFVEYEEMHEIDKWAMLKLHKLIEEVTNAYENYEFYKVHYLINNFCTIDMSAIYLDIIKDRIYVEGKKSKLRRSAQTVLYEALVALTKMMAPIISFTAEEVYDHLPTSIKKYETIFAERWPKYNEKYINSNLEEKWEAVLSLREDVLKALEEKRKEKVIGNSLDAKVILEVQNEKLKQFLKDFDENFLADFFIVSQCEFGDVENGFEGKNAKIKIMKAEGEKCERCWKIHPQTGKDERYPEVCPRCAEVLKSEEF
ncbi:MAG TPA: isoleucine--tRNA ligase [Defluviitoga sp.]|nr:isoleucine--tRNA ligase [Defluviitoga sp.]HOP24270.1 isoleucine--tRNA ligase [Defluviitoga sp.]HPZ28138.1 isoleucine--tRNA ligase [Defluviitoga sp.]HQD62028.1 isoleucine--tRNA ligase [Defluviitoga sp.]